MNLGWAGIGLAILLWGIDKDETFEDKHPFVKKFKKFIGKSYIVFGIIIIVLSTFL